MATRPAAPERPRSTARVETGAGGARVTGAQAVAAALGWIVLVGMTVFVVVEAEPSHVRIAATAVIAMVVGAATLVVVGTTLLAARASRVRGHSRRETVPARELPDPLGAQVDLGRARAALERSDVRELDLSLDGGVKRYEPTS